MNGIKGSQLRKVVLVSKRNVDDTMMRERRHGSDSCRLLSTSLTSSRHKQTTVLAPKTAASPKTTSLVPERLIPSHTISQIVHTEERPGEKRTFH